MDTNPFFDPSSIKSMKQVDELSGVEFELFLAYLYERNGWLVELTSATGDYGADLVVRKPGRVVIIQAKHYSGNVGYDAVKEAFTAKAIYEANEAVVISTAEYTDQAKVAAKKLNIRLLGRYDVAALLHREPGGPSDEFDGRYKELASRIDRTSEELVKCGMVCSDFVKVNGSNEANGRRRNMELFCDQLGPLGIIEEDISDYIEALMRRLRLPVGFDSKEESQFRSGDLDRRKSLFRKRYDYYQFGVEQEDCIRAIINTYYRHSEIASNELTEDALKILSKVCDEYYSLHDMKKALLSTDVWDGEDARRLFDSMLTTMESIELRVDGLKPSFGQFVERAIWPERIDQREAERKAKAEKERREAELKSKMLSLANEYLPKEAELDRRHKALADKRDSLNPVLGILERRKLAEQMEDNLREKRMAYERLQEKMGANGIDLKDVIDQIRSTG